jgi:hypothetical protein
MVCGQRRLYRRTQRRRIGDQRAAESVQVALKFAAVYWWSRVSGSTAAPLLAMSVPLELAPEVSCVHDRLVVPLGVGEPAQVDLVAEAAATTGASTPPMAPATPGVLRRGRPSRGPVRSAPVGPVVEPPERSPPTRKRSPGEQGIGCPLVALAPQWRQN